MSKQINVEALPLEIREQLDEIKGLQKSMLLDLEPQIQKGVTAEKGVAELKEKVAKMATDTGSALDRVGEKITAFAEQFDSYKEQAKEIQERLDAQEKADSKKRYQLPAVEQFDAFNGRLSKAFGESGILDNAEGGAEKSLVQPGKFVYLDLPHDLSAFKGWHMARPRAMKDISVSGNTVYPNPTYTGIIGPGERPLSIMDLMPIIPTSSRLVYFPSETSLTDNAGMQTEGSTKGETSFQVTVGTEAIKTVAHFSEIPLQILADMPALQGYINSRMLFLMEQEAEDQVLTGNNTGQNLNGLVTQATAFDTTLDDDLGVSNVQDLDRLRLAAAQVLVGSQFAPDAFVLHPYDWAALELLKDGDNRYLFGMPQQSAQPRIWGMPVVSSVGQTSGDFLTGAFRINAAIYDREQSQVAISTEDSTNFRDNKATIRAERRMALVVYRTLAFVEGDLSAAVT